MNLSPYTTAQLLAAFNAHTGQDVKRFASRSVALARVGQLVDSGALDIDAVLGLKCETPKTEETPAVAKKPHAADEAAAAIVAGAVSFNVHMRINARTKLNEPAKTIAEAAQIAARIEAANPTKLAMVYAIDASGASALVPVATLREAIKTAPAAEEISDEEVPASEKRARTRRVRIAKYEGDDAYSWALFLDGRPVYTGMSRSEAAWRRTRFIDEGSL